MKFTKGIICLLLAALMLVSFTACKKGNTASELSDEIEYIYQYESAPADGGEQSDTQSGGNIQEGNNQDAQSNTTQGDATASNDQGSATSDFDKKAEKYRGTKVVLATWRDPNVDEDGPVIKKFKKKYGIDVEIDTIGQGVYVNTIVSRIAAENAPDIYFCTATFPSGLECLQPIDAAELDLSDPIWDQSMLEQSKVNGKSYLVNTVGNIWNEITCVFYNKKIFRDNNITTPEEYYNAGNWTFETFEKAMRDVKEASKDYVGAYIDYNALLGTTDSAYWRWENGTFTNGVDEKFADVTRYVASWKKDGLIRGLSQSNTADFKNGKCGMALCEAWGLKRTGYWRNMNFDDIGFTYVPDFDANNKATVSGCYRGWGICKDAKNPVAAGVFLRYYLDVNNYDTASAFITPEAESFFFKLTSSGNIMNKAYYFIGGSDGLATATSHAKIIQIANNGDPGQVKASLDALKNTIDSDVKDLNNYIAKQK